MSLHGQVHARTRETRDLEDGERVLQRPNLAGLAENDVGLLGIMQLAGSGGMRGGLQAQGRVTWLQRLALQQRGDLGIAVHSVFAGFLKRPQVSALLVQIPA